MYCVCVMYVIYVATIYGISHSFKLNESIWRCFEYRLKGCDTHQKLTSGLHMFGAAMWLPKEARHRELMSGLLMFSAGEGERKRDSRFIQCALFKEARHTENCWAAFKR